MSYTVTWSPISRLTYYQILEYLDEKWTIKELEAVETQQPASRFSKVCQPTRINITLGFPAAKFMLFQQPSFSQAN